MPQVLLGENKDGDLFLYKTGKHGMTVGWTPEREAVVFLPEDVAQALRAAHIEPHWSAKESLATVEEDPTGGLAETDSWALGHIARWHLHMPWPRREQILKEMSPTAQRIALLIFDPDADVEASEKERITARGLRLRGAKP